MGSSIWPAQLLYDDTCCDLGDFSLSATPDVLALTSRRRRQPAGQSDGVAMESPAWMKDHNAFSQVGSRPSTTRCTGQYFAKYVRVTRHRAYTSDYVLAAERTDLLPRLSVECSVNTSGLQPS